jgi:hypothetical protein
MPDQDPFITPAVGGVRHDEPDGLTMPGGDNALRDTVGPVNIQSGDWQVNPPGEVHDRKGSVHNITNRANRRHG